MIAGGVASPFEAISSSVANNSESDMYGDISRVREIFAPAVSWQYSVCGLF